MNLDGSFDGQLIKLNCNMLHILDGMGHYKIFYLQSDHSVVSSCLFQAATPKPMKSTKSIEHLPSQLSRIMVD